MGLVDYLVDTSYIPHLGKLYQPSELNMELLGEVARVMHAAKSSRAETPLPKDKMTQDASVEYPGTDIQPTLAISNNQMSHLQKYHNDLRHNVPNNLK